jgi:flavodoxin
MKILVLYYSFTGNNKYLANKIAKKLNADLSCIEPRFNVLPFLILSSMTKISFGIKPIKNQIAQYDAVVVCGPIWAGQLISPVYNFIKKYKKDIQMLHFATSCGSTDEIKETRFGYAKSFKYIQKLIGNKCGVREAFPITLVVPEDKKKNDEAVMKTRLSDENFKGDIELRLEHFTQKVIQDTCNK